MAQLSAEEIIGISRRLAGASRDMGLMNEASKVELTAKLSPEAQEAIADGIAVVMAELIRQNILPENILQNPTELAKAVSTVLRNIAAHKAILSSLFRRMKNIGAKKSVRDFRRGLAGLY